ncbi:hypothetical protein [Peptacetobacter sp.]|uniref:hypothetical protein n=1 Tax=unclassified Peptacetobacter TaxID=2991974 RepID=UPI002632673C|nr:hypothetical protein [Peptacetobacter sp.]MEE0450891.1 hypothetical protein [Peptacetobacter sp.]
MKCQRCGHPMKFGEEKCRKCGTKIKKTEEYIKMEEERAKNAKKDQIAMVVSGAILMFVLVFGMYVLIAK